MDRYPLLVGFSFAMGVALIANTTLSVLYLFGRRLTYAVLRRPGRLAALGLTSEKEKGEQNTIDAVYGLSSIPWTSLYAASALLALILFVTLGTYLRGTKAALLMLPGLVWLARRYLMHQRRRFLVAQVRQLLVDIRLHMSLAGSLLLGLENIARTTGESSPVYRALQRRMSGGSAKSGLDVLQLLAGDLKSLHLMRVAQRVKSAQQSSGVIGIDQAIASSIEELNEEIAGQVEEQMQQMPTRITLLAMPFLLGPIVILLFYPLVDRILSTLSGTAIGGGF
ncbi:hypothetical protein LARV_00962 [Longilinea arvoryzae]|uniref:Uncharacterized protein n=1 Tax=Longilinea arvoryzae TaxID=360412 RepID=A0A0S7BH68_9CHLR|nr:hypothetical protein [Longilinea arvoryzae]GAP13211.1 hypothetical protein LARV_00962 [Longilinea arvoryzae]